MSRWLTPDERRLMELDDKASLQHMYTMWYDIGRSNGQLEEMQIRLGQQVTVQERPSCFYLMRYYLREHRKLVKKMRKEEGRRNREYELQRCAEKKASRVNTVHA